METVLKINNLCKDFGKKRIIDSLSLEVIQVRFSDF
jgi:ABC-type uncharacterized transport system ATPase subunit